MTFLQSFFIYVFKSITCVKDLDPDPNCALDPDTNQGCGSAIIFADPDPAVFLNADPEVQLPKKCGSGSSKKIKITL